MCKVLAIVRAGIHMPRTYVNADRAWWLICNSSMQETETARWLTGVAKTVNSGFQGNGASIILIK